MNDMEYVRTEVCTERHQRNREELKTLETRDKQPRQGTGRLVGGFCGACSHAGRDQPANAGTVEGTAKRTAAIEDQPRKRWEQVLGIIVNWATLALLGLLAVKIGL